MLDRQARLAALLATITLASAGCDQGTKWLAKEHLQGRPPVTLAGDLVVLTYAENRGGFLSLGARLPEAARDAVFMLGVPLILLVFIAYMLRGAALTPRKAAAAGLVVGGGCGNLIDRFAYDGRVVDFLNIGVGPIRTGVFNLADTAVMLGAAYIVLTASRVQGPEPRRPTGPR